MSTETLVVAGASAVGVVIVFVLGRLSAKDRTRAEEILDVGLDVVLGALRPIAAKTPTPVDDWVVVGMEALNAYLESHGVSPDKVSPTSVEKAKATFAALHGFKSEVVKNG